MDLETRLSRLDTVEAPELWPVIEQRALQAPSPQRRMGVIKVALAAALAVSLAGSFLVLREGPTLVQAAADVLSSEDVSFRFEAEGKVGGQAWRITGRADGPDRLHYVDELEREWLIVEDRAYLKQGPAWSRWPHNWPRQQRSEVGCLSGGSRDVDFVHEIAGWLERCPSWQETGRERIRGVPTRKFEFRAGSGDLAARVWIDEEGRPRRFQMLAFGQMSSSGVWTLWGFEDQIQIEEPRVFSGPGERGKSFEVGEKILLAKGDLDGEEWRLLAWEKAPEQLCVGTESGEVIDTPDGPISKGGAGAACGSRHEPMRRSKYFYQPTGWGSGWTVDKPEEHRSHVHVTTSNKVARVRVTFSNDRTETLSSISNNSFPDLRFFVHFYKGEDKPVTLEALDAKGRVLEKRSLR
ncbi:MAG TPA: hypothetical protein VND22_02930 [Actinomycetota bacterium]|nr:hypothetical protein [Actinomycetota bacterium]